VSNTLFISKTVYYTLQLAGFLYRI